MFSRDGTKHLNDALKSKIVSLKLYTAHTNEEISEQCECSVS